ncbi:MAG TPA: hypothetical protein P5075_07220 [Eubacteriales bacterium]|nr:hypothetical protein [Eubacteriales bacterium]
MPEIIMHAVLFFNPAENLFFAGMKSVKTGGLYGGLRTHDSARRETMFCLIPAVPVYKSVKTGGLYGGLRRHDSARRETMFCLIPAVPV